MVTTLPPLDPLRPVAVAPVTGGSFQDRIKYNLGGGGAVAGGGADMAQVIMVRQDGTVRPLVDPYTKLQLHFASSDPGWANLYSAYMAQVAAGAGGEGGSGGGYGYGGGGGGGGGGPTYYPQFDYNQAQGLWNTYITGQGFGGQDRMGDWARDYYQQTLLDFNSDFTQKNPPKEIPVEGTTEAPAMSQTSDYAKYIKDIYGKGTLNDIYSSIAPSRRGDNYAAFTGTGRTVAWG
jgi:hypothetical protein